MQFWEKDYTRISTNMEEQDPIHIQHEIMTLLNKNNSSKCTFHFETTLSQGKVSLHLLSYNPQHHKKFLFHTETGEDGPAAHKMMLDFVQELPESKDTKNYKIVWSNKLAAKQVTSYFFGKTEFDALHKLYFNQNKDNVTFISMELSPSA